MSKLHAHKLMWTEAELARIANARNSGVTLAAIGKRFGVSPTTIGDKLREAEAKARALRVQPQGQDGNAPGCNPGQLGSTPGCGSNRAIGDKLREAKAKARVHLPVEKGAA